MVRDEVTGEFGATVKVFQVDDDGHTWLVPWMRCRLPPYYGGRNRGFLAGIAAAGQASWIRCNRLAPVSAQDERSLPATLILSRSFLG